MRDARALCRALVLFEVPFVLRLTSLTVKCRLYAPAVKRGWAAGRPSRVLSVRESLLLELERFPALE